ncbi:MAG: sulfurtransferase-like selenium metabolism protein YedF [Sarcina sp.]
MKTIDCSGLECPMPVIKTKKYFETIEEGLAKIIVDNEVAKNNLEKLAQNNNMKFNSEEVNGKFILTIEKTMINSENSMKDTQKQFSILISSEFLGHGDDDLGKTLMKSYLYALSEASEIPRKIMFINSGVKLVANESAVLESLNKLNLRGVELCSCGICLDFYGLKEAVGIGEITNMYAIVEEMNSISNLIKL